MNLPTIVMIDSSPEAADLVRFALWRNDLRCNFLVYPDAPTATRCLLQQRRRSSDGPAPALVLLESDLDYTDGLDLLRAMRADNHLSSVPVVVFPSYDMEGEAAALAAGATAYLPKPVDAELYTNCIKQFFQRWCLPQQIEALRVQRASMMASPHFGRRRGDWSAGSVQ